MKDRDLKNLYLGMLRIRRVEEAIADEYPAKEMKCPIHLSIGQEAVPVVLCSFLNDQDHVYSTHRCHAHYLAKAGDLKAMIAELYGRSTGCCRGKGGSMHLAWPETGMMGASALVAGTIPLATGSALAFAREKSNRVAVAFFGDGGSEEGVFYESMNFAQLHKLPMLFVCENNGYATYSAQEARQANSEIASRAKAFGMASERIDGSDLPAMIGACERAVTRARRGDGPTLLEFLTCRWRDHVGPGDDFALGYRTESEVAAWRERCALPQLENNFAKDELAKMEAEIAKEIAEAFAFARQSPFPDKTELYDHLYA